MYGDIDYMKHKLDFTYDTEKFGGLPEYVDELRANHTRYIVILVGISYNHQNLMLKNLFPPCSHYAQYIQLESLVNKWKATKLYVCVVGSGNWNTARYHFRSRRRKISRSGRGSGTGRVHQRI